ncbi:MAG: hydrogenase maturation protease [Nitrospirae bacterium]|nr:MAG: hydrogenase maturation protease [Nitrospirota bacterium]
MKTVVIGLGNPILTDDGVGIRVSRMIRDLLAQQQTAGTSGDTIDIKEVYAGGIRLMDAMTGYDRACIVDAMVTGRFRPGEVSEFDPAELCGTRNIVCTHDTNLSTALELGRMLGLHLPSAIKIWGIEARDVTSFSEQLTDEIDCAVPVAARAVLSELQIDADVREAMP